MAPTLYYTRDIPTSTGFQPEPSGRGTIGIIWTCLSTILLSSWSSFHCTAYDPNNSFNKEAIKTYCFKFAVAFLFPEAAAVESIDNLCDALRLRKKIRQVGGPQFADFSLSQAFLCAMEGVWLKKAGSEGMQLLDHSTFLELVRSGSLSFSDLPTDDEIADKSKRDWTLKLVSIIQTVWFIVSVIARLSRRYPVSLYEDITLANAVCGVIEFTCWFRCPQDIRLPFIINLDNARSTNNPSTAAEREATVESRQLSEAAMEHEASSAPLLPVLADIRMDKEDKKTPITKRMPLIQEETRHRTSSTTQSVEFPETSEIVSVAIFAVFSVLFSSIHIAAWNYSFCSLAEAWIWRGGAIALTVLGLCISFAIAMNREGQRSKHEWTLVLAFAVGIPLYPLVRTMMLGVALASFRKAPARLYETPSWTQYWPHI